jgi:repressor LexA
MIHPIQKQLLELSQRYDLSKMGLRQIGKLIGVEHPQKVKFHLEKIGLIRNGIKKRPVHAKKPLGHSGDNIVSIPILGLANCGDATMIAENKIEGILPVSKKLLPSNHKQSDLFAIKAVGSSMNRADINGKSIEDGDYVIIDNSDRDAHNGDYVLSIISGLANIKRFVEDQENEQIVLESESDKFFPPIHIHKDDLDEYLLNGKVIGIIKQPNTNDEPHYEFIY